MRLWKFYTQSKVSPTIGIFHPNWEYQDSLSLLNNQMSIKEWYTFIGKWVIGVDWGLGRHVSQSGRDADNDHHRPNWPFFSCDLWHTVCQCTDLCGKARRGTEGLNGSHLRQKCSAEQGVESSTGGFHGIAAFLRFYLQPRCRPPASDNDALKQL